MTSEKGHPLVLARVGKPGAFFLKPGFRVLKTPNPGSGLKYHVLTKVPTAYV